MPLDAATALDLMADSLAAQATVLRLHTGDPGTGNLNPTTAGDQAVALNSDGSGDLTVTNVAFTGGAASGPCTWCTLWNTGATVRYGKFQLTGDQTFNAAGEYTVSSLTIDGSTT